MKYIYKRLDKEKITPQIFQQIVDVENAEGDGYTKQQLENIWLTDPKDDNFGGMRSCGSGHTLRIPRW